MELDLRPPPGGPRHGECRACGAPVLVVRCGQETVLLEPAEVLEGPIPCPRCLPVAQRGDRPGRCVTCGGSRTIGGPLPAWGVAVDEHDQARAFAGRRLQGEAVHLLHECAVARAC